MKLYNYLFVLISFSILLPAPSFGKDTSRDYLSHEMRRTQATAGLASIIVSLFVLFKGSGVFSNAPQASDSSRAFIEDIASQHGITDKLQIKIGDGYAAGIGTIIVPFDENYYYLRTTLDTALENYRYATNDKESLQAIEELNEHIGVLDHEFTHYKNHDMRNSLVIASLLNLCIYSAYFSFEYKVLSEKLRKSDDSAKWFYTNVSALGLSAVTGLLSCLE